MDIPLSVFFPAFNEEGNIERTVLDAVGVLDKLKITDYEILVIDDGSKDKTPQIIDNLAKKNPKIKPIHHKTNLGYGEALKSGFYNAAKDYIVFTDSDGQFDFSEVSGFIKAIQEADLIIGFRKKRNDPMIRLILSKIAWGFILYLLLGLKVRDIDCGFKMIKKSVLQKIPHLKSTRGAMINPELIIKAKKAGFKIKEIGVNHYPRTSGKPTGANLKVALKSYVDLFKLWLSLR